MLNKVHFKVERFVTFSVEIKGRLREAQSEQRVFEKTKINV